MPESYRGLLSLWRDGALSNHMLRAATRDIAKTFVVKYSVSVEDLGYDLVMLTPARAILTTKVCLRGCRCAYHKMHPID